MGKIKLNLVSGGVVEKPLLSAFKTNNASYVILDNEINGSMGLPIILVCKLDQDKLIKILDQDEWQVAKEYLKNIIAGQTVEYIKLPNELKADDIYYTQLTLPVPSFDALKSFYDPDQVLPTNDDANGMNMNTGTGVQENVINNTVNSPVNETVNPVPNVNNEASNVATAPMPTVVESAIVAPTPSVDVNQPSPTEPVTNVSEPIPSPVDITPNATEVSPVNPMPEVTVTNPVNPIPDVAPISPQVISPVSEPIAPAVDVATPVTPSAQVMDIPSVEPMTNINNPIDTPIPTVDLNNPPVEPTPVDINPIVTDTITTPDVAPIDSQVTPEVTPNPIDIGPVVGPVVGSVEPVVNDVANQVVPNVNNGVNNVIDTPMPTVEESAIVTPTPNVDMNQTTPIEPVNNDLSVDKFKDQKEAFMQACENMFDALVQKFEKELENKR